MLTLESGARVEGLNASYLSVPNFHLPDSYPCLPFFPNLLVEFLEMLLPQKVLSTSVFDVQMFFFTIGSLTSLPLRCAELSPSSLCSSCLCVLIAFRVFLPRRKMRR
jgi:hypothetical protein